MTTMTSAELDPLFLKAISLLRSKNPDSARQLDQLVQEHREKTYGIPSSKKNLDEGKATPDPIKQSKAETKDKGSPLTLMEKLEEITNITEEKGNDSVTIKEEAVEEITVGSSLEPSHKKARLHSKISISDTSPTYESEENDNIPIDDIFEMDFDGPMCKVCHLNKRSEEENLLVECSECHAHFHQMCHKPNVSTKDLNDPRLIWYCSRCTKKMSKEMAAQQQSSSNNNGKPGIDTLTPKTVSNPFQQAKPFRRNITTSDGASKSVENITSAKNTSVAPATLTSTDPAISMPKEVVREGSPSSKQRPRDLAVNSMKRLEMVKKRANKMQQLMKQSNRK